MLSITFQLWHVQDRLLSDQDMPELMMDSIIYSYVTKTKRIKTRFDATRSIISIELTKYPTYIGPILCWSVVLNHMVGKINKRNLDYH
jgi:hypothetical protein